MQRLCVEEQLRLAAASGGVAQESKRKRPRLARLLVAFQPFLGGLRVLLRALAGRKVVDDCLKLRGQFTRRCWRLLPPRAGLAAVWGEHILLHQAKPTTMVMDKRW